MQSFMELLNNAVGTDADDITIWQMLVRSLIIFLVGIILVRTGKKRFLGKIAAFDFILAIIIGSLLSRAITNEDYFFEILGSCILFIGLHQIFSWIAANSDFFGNWVKGHEEILLRDGEILWEAMNKRSLSEHDLMQTLRLNANVDDVKKVKIARLERNGDISVILKEDAKK